MEAVQRCKNHKEITSVPGILRNKWVMKVVRAMVVHMGSYCAADIFFADSARILPKGANAVDIPCSNCGNCLRVRRLKGKTK